MRFSMWTASVHQEDEIDDSFVHLSVDFSQIDLLVKGSEQSP